MDGSKEPTMNVWLDVKMSVQKKGKAIKNIVDVYESSVIFQQSITKYSPAIGSFGGGTQVKLEGHGLDVGTLKARLFDPIELSLLNCEIVSQSYSEMVIQLPAIYQLEKLKYETRIIVQDSTYENSEQRLGNSLPANFTFQRHLTPIMTSITPTEFDRAGNLVSIGISIPTGYTKDHVKVLIGGKSAEITSYSDPVLQAKIPGLTGGDHRVIVAVGNLGHAFVNKTALNDTVLIKEKVSGVVPSSGSIYGNTRIVVNGNGFVPGQTVVKLGNQDCVIESMSETEIVVNTPKGSGEQYVVVIANQKRYPGNVKFVFDALSTPTVMSVSPEKNVGGETLTINGNNFVGNKDDYIVSVGTANCSVQTVSTKSVTCLLGNHQAGTEKVKLYLKGFGDSNSDKTFIYELKVNDSGKVESGLGGGVSIMLAGRGFGPSAVVTICDEVSEILRTPTENELQIVSPLYKQYEGVSRDVQCDIKISQGGESVTFANAYTYVVNKTAKITKVSPNRSGTGGGVVVTITGVNFKVGATVLIAGVKCVTKSVTATQIVCTTGTPCLFSIIFYFTFLF